MVTVAVILAVLAILLIGGYTLLRSAGEAPQAGATAPDFTLNSQDGAPISLHDFRGKWVVLYFYPKDFTSGCTIEARNFQRDLSEYEQRNAVILGVSVQDEKTHQAFCTKEGLHFKLLADTHKEVSGRYGSLMNLMFTKLSSRHTFLIGPQGVIRKVWLNVDVQSHSRNVFSALEQLQTAATN